MEAPVYNKIGSAYNTTRRADPYIATRMYHLLQPKAGSTYLDVGCGTGNYLSALSGKGLHFIGLDPSEVMLREAQLKCPGTHFIQAPVEHLPVEDGSMDGAMAMFTIHHWQDIPAGLNQIGRVLKPGSPLVFLSFTSEQLDGYWLRHYFPRMIERSKLTPDLPAMEKMLKDAGFGNMVTEKYFVQPDLQDHFLYSNKYRPEQYLRKEVRNGASSFTVFAEPDEVAAGLELLEADIRSGRIDAIIKDYENDLGDYLFIRATKL